MTAAHSDQTVAFTAISRDDRTPALLRREGLVPMELYGTDTANMHVMADARSLSHLLAEHGTTTLIDLTIDKNNPVKVLLREPQYHPVTHAVLHLDLFKVNLKEKIVTDVPIEFVGASAAVIDLGGTLITSKDTVEVECLPADLPHELTIDISRLATFDDSLHVRDIIVPAGVTVLDEPDETLASVTEPRSEEELAALNEVVEENIEEVAVEEKGKEEELGEEGKEGEVTEPATE